MHRRLKTARQYDRSNSPQSEWPRLDYTVRRNAAGAKLRFSAAMRIDELAVDKQADGTTSPMRYVAAFRTYAWDEGIAELARRFFMAVPSARKVVLVDETRGPIETSGYEKVSHTENTACPGLPNHPRGKSLWFNVDYGIYCLEREMPGFDYYLLSESDLAVNLNLEPMVQFAIDNRIDLIAHRMEPSTPGWFWHNHGLVLSENPWRSLLFFMLLSRRAIACLLAERERLGRLFKAGEIALWPFCEAFVPTTLKCAQDMRFAEVREFAATENLNFRPWLSLHDPCANLPGSLAHPVLGGKRFVANLLSIHPARDFFREGSELREGLLNQMPFEDVLGPLRRALAMNRDYAGVALLEQEAATHGWIFGATVDLALFMPAVASSVSSFSRLQDTRQEAGRVNAEPVPFDHGFHTRREANPWWMADLLGEHLVEEIAIVNRRIESGRFSTFCIETSLDGRDWTTRFMQADPVDVSAEPESPWSMRFRDPFAARYVRIVLLGMGPFHLRRVQIFGRILAAAARGPGLEGLCENEYRWPAGPVADLALCKPGVSSSVSRWSARHDPISDAQGANGESLAEDCGFHTRKEDSPWWMVDLLGEPLVEEIALVNRRIESQRFSTFRIETSSDGKDWTTRFTKADSSAISTDPESPWRTRFTEPFCARYVRIVLAGTGPFHLRRIQVFGRILPGRAGIAAEEGRGHRWPPGPISDLALCKPAVASSVSRWTPLQAPQSVAGCANGESLASDCVFHTRKEANPWWLVDLLGEPLVEEVAIVNRRIEPQRFSTFRIETSCDGRDWTTQFTQAEPVPVSTDPESPWRVRFPEPFSARYLRIVVLGLGPLHLRRIQVLGRTLPAASSSSVSESSCEAEGWWPAGPMTDLALCKPAVSSSVSSWSLRSDPESDARGANGESLANDCGFHTRKEANPWWMVNLLGESLVDEIAIVNRRVEPQRFSTFCIETSCDGRVWTTRFRQSDPAVVSVDPELPWRLQFSSPFTAQYLRILVLGVGPLHLRRIQIFGRARLPRTGISAQENSAGLGHRWPTGPMTDLALLKPALTSSVSAWSHSQDPELDASGANGETLPSDYGFHTDEELNPWWRVDLLGPHIVEEAAIVNRPHHSHRFRTFCIETSLDGTNWTLQFMQATPADVSIDPGSPWWVRFPFPVLARYIRIVLLGLGPLHLRRVQVFGGILAAPANAAPTACLSELL
jgi:hypothetical protein